MISKENEKLIKMVEDALNLELEGKKFYEEASRKAKNQLGKKVFASLAEDEEIHYERIKEIYSSLQSEGAWPKDIGKSIKLKDYKKLFSELIKDLDKDVRITHDEMEALKVGMNLEEKSQKLYENLLQKFLLAIEKKFYQKLIKEERSHYLILLDSYEYLLDPDSWFRKREKGGLDGA